MKLEHYKFNSECMGYFSDKGIFENEYNSLVKLFDLKYTKVFGLFPNIREYINMYLDMDYF